MLKSEIPPNILIHLQKFANRPVIIQIHFQYVQVRDQCDDFVVKYTDLIIDMLTHDVSPEMVRNARKMFRDKRLH